MKILPMTPVEAAGLVRSYMMNSTASEVIEFMKHLQPTIDSVQYNVQGMRKLTIAFDCDGTLVTTDSAKSKKIVANERVRSLLVALANSKNVKIVVWSGGGELWARQVGAAIGIDKYVWKYMDKNHLGKDEYGNHMFDPGLTPDVAVDDIQSCALGRINIIVREK